MGEPRCLLRPGRRLQSGRRTWRHRHCSGELQEGEGTQADLLPPENRSNRGSGAIRPFDGQSNEPTLWMLGINVPLPILVMDGAHDRQAHAS